MYTTPLNVIEMSN